MNEAIVTRWNETVAPDDTVLILGDLCMGKIDESLPFAGQLQGHKLLVPGNHDRCHPKFTGKNKTVSHWQSRYTEVGGIEAILHTDTSFEFGDTAVRVCHFPFEGDHTGEEDRYTELRPSRNWGNEWLVHGHVHDAWRQRGRQINVGLDAWGGRLLQIEEIEAMIEAGPQDLGPIPWPVPFTNKEHQ